MSWQLWLPDLVREARYLLGGGSTCPWGAIGLLVVVSCSVSCCCGFILGALVFSHQCRRIGLFAARTLAANWVGGAPAGADLRGRLAEYGRGL